MSRTAKLIRSLSKPPGPKPLIRLRWVKEESGFVWSKYCDNWLEPKNSRTVALTILKLNNWFESILLVWFFSFLTNRWNPILNKFCNNSPTDLTRRFFKWSISSWTVFEIVKLWPKSDDSRVYQFLLIWPSFRLLTRL